MTDTLTLDLGDASLREIRARFKEHGVKVWEVAFAGEEVSVQLQKDTYRFSMTAALSMPLAEYIASCLAQLARRGDN